ncbi:MAG TPA: sulfate ABC transporter substrate-binding protein [Acetobacteraceae bacterium]|nr:sulfate ABC transporter substrate-binding protein [Acetobacteraceae bacterium]
MKRRTLLATAPVLGPALAPAIVSFRSLAAAPSDLLNASYSATVELFRAYNALFEESWRAKTGTPVTIHDSNGGSGAEARAVIEGLPADVVTLALAFDVDEIARAGLIAPDWRSRLPDGGVPFTSTIVFLVRQGNPKEIRDWPDLVRPGVQVVTPNPKTSGGARYNILAAYAWALKANGEDAEKARAYLGALLRHVPVLDASARNATLSFVQRGLGDVLIAWESEALLAIAEAGKKRFELVMPSLSIRAEPPVAVVDKVVDRRGTRALAEAYLGTLYGPEAQELIANNYYRPRLAAVARKYAARFKPVPMVSVDEAFGGWDAAQKMFFADGGIFDQASVQSQ